jgi:hypothetical protein
MKYPVDILGLPVEDDRIVISSGWTLKNLFQYSIYYKNDYNRPLYEVIIVTLEDGNKKLEHHPWIAITPLRFAKITSLIRKFVLTSDYIDTHLANGLIYRVYCPLVRYIIIKMCESFRETKRMTYDTIEYYFVSRFKDLLKSRKLATLICAWLVACMIELGFVDIEYNLP